MMTDKLNKITFLYSSLKEAQDNIRTYDTKAQIMGIGFIFTIGMIAKFINIDSAQLNGINTLVILFLILSPIVLFASVLYPTRKPSS